MYASAFLYTGLVLLLTGLINVVRPIQRLHVRTRGRPFAIAGSGAVLMLGALLAPASASRVTTVRTRIDEVVPVWQFNEVHTIRIAAPPDRVFAALERVTADEILFFRTLTWIRRGGRDLRPSIMNATPDAPIIKVAIDGGFLRLADEASREIVLGTVVIAPPGSSRPFTPAVFHPPIPPGFAVAAMNFLVIPDTPHASILSTETRVFASDTGTRRRFAKYWRVIYPGSAMIRCMWLRAVSRRATGGHSGRG